jgi:hypothetical protein
MSFVPAPQKASLSTFNNGPPTGLNNVTSSAVAEAAAAEKGGVEDAFITSRTFDLYWVDKTALMYKDGYIKVSELLSTLLILMLFIFLVDGRKNGNSILVQ